MLDPTGLYWTLVEASEPRKISAWAARFRPLGRSHHVSDWTKFGMYCPPREGWPGARCQPQILLTLLLALPCNVHPSPPSGVERHAQPRFLPSRPDSGASRQLQVTPGGTVRGGMYKYDNDNSNSKVCTIVLYIMEQYFNARILLLIFLKFVSIFHFLLFSPLFQFHKLIFSLFLKTNPPNDDMFFW